LLLDRLLLIGWAALPDGVLLLLLPDVVTESSSAAVRPTDSNRRAAF
jgi:hypothetical protein